MSTTIGPAVIESTAPSLIVLEVEEVVAALAHNMTNTTTTPTTTVVSMDELDAEALPLVSAQALPMSAQPEQDKKAAGISSGIVIALCAGALLVALALVSVRRRLCVPHHNMANQNVPDAQICEEGKAGTSSAGVASWSTVNLVI